MPSKWKLHQLYSKNPKLRGHLPETSVLSERSLDSYLNKFGSVYIKGKNQHMGMGIVKAWKSGQGYRFIRVKGKSVYASTIGELLKKVAGGRAVKNIIVQETIDLASVNGRPFDIRVMLMRDGMGKWQNAGMLAKIAGKDSIITNVRLGGGYVMTVDDALARSLKYEPDRIAQIKRDLYRISNEAVRYSVRSGYSSFEAGLDMAIDRKGNLWIIEVNLMIPSHALFKKLKDQTVYRTIKKLAAAYRGKKQGAKAAKAVKATKLPEAPKTDKAPKPPEASHAEKVPNSPEAPNVEKAPKPLEAPNADKTPKAPKATKAAKIPKKPQASKAAKAPKVPQTTNSAKAPKTPQAPKAAKAPKVPQAPKAAKAPKAPQAPKAAKAPKVPQAPNAAKAPATGLK